MTLGDLDERLADAYALGIEAAAKWLDDNGRWTLADHIRALLPAPMRAGRSPMTLEEVAAADGPCKHCGRGICVGCTAPADGPAVCFHGVRTCPACLRKGNERP